MQTSTFTLAGALAASGLDRSKFDELSKQYINLARFECDSLAVPGDWLDLLLEFDHIHLDMCFSRNYEPRPNLEDCAENDRWSCKLRDNPDAKLQQFETFGDAYRFLSALTPRPLNPQPIPT